LEATAHNVDAFRDTDKQKTKTKQTNTTMTHHSNPIGATGVPPTAALFAAIENIGRNCQDGSAAGHRNSAK